MKSIIGRYLTAGLVLPFVVSSGFFATFLLTFQLLRITRLVVNKGVDLFLIAKLLFNISITFIPIVIPLSILFSAIYSLNRLSSDSELVAMRSLGLSLGRLLIPFLLAGAMIGVTLFGLSYSYIPRAETRFKEIVAYLTTRGVLTDIKAGQFFTDIPTLTIWAEEVTNKGKDLESVFIQGQEENNDQKVIYAQKGTLINEQQGDRIIFNLKLTHGNLIKRSGDGNLEKILFEEYLFPLNDRNLKIPLSTKNSMKTIPELAEIMEKDKRARIKLKISDEDFNRAHLEFWTRINNGVMCFLFSFLGFSLGVQKTRGKVRGTTVICLIVLITYYAVFFAGISFARAGNVPAPVAIFGPSCMIFLLSIIFYRRLRWVA